MNKRRQPSTGQTRKDKHTEIFKSFFDRGIQTVHKFLNTHDAVCVQVMCTVKDMQTIREGLYYW